MPVVPLEHMKPAHGVELRWTDNKLIMKDSEALDWHVARVVDKSLAYKRVTLQIEYEPLPQCSTNFYVNGWGGVDLAVVSASGEIVENHALELSVAKRGSTFCLTLTYNSDHPSVSFGTATEKGFYRGHGREQFAIHALSYTSEPLGQHGEGASRLSLVDVGAAGGLQARWVPFVDSLDVTMIEPSQAEASRLRNLFPNFRIIEEALYHKSGVHELNVTRFPECSSLLEPNCEELGRYRAAPLFEVVERVDVFCERYDTLHANGVAPKPDVIKLDVQGAEYEALEGFGDLLSECIGIELETHFYEIYKGQKLIGDIIELLSNFDLRLRRLEPQFSFDADLVEVNAFFSKPRGTLTSDRAWKLDLLENVWKLSVSDNVLPALRKLGR